MDEKQLSITLITMYKDLISTLMQEVSLDEKSILTNPDIGMVKDGGRAYYTDQIRNIMAHCLANYSVKDISAWKELESYLTDLLSSEFNYEDDTTKRNTEIISRNWATNFALHQIESLEKHYINQ